MMRTPLTIKQLLLLAFLLAGLLPATLVSFLSFYQARDALKKEISRDLQTLSAAVASDVERILFERIQNVHSWSQLAIMQDLQIGDIDKRLSIFLNETQASYQHEYLALHVVDLNHIVIASSQVNAIAQPYHKAPSWFQVKVAHKVLDVSHVKQDSMLISQAIVDSNTGQNIGALIVEFNWKTLTDLLNASVNGSASAALLDHQQHVLASSSDWGKQGHVLHASSALKSQLLFPDWSVRIEKSRSSAVAPVHRLGYVFLALLLATILFALLLVRPIARAITQPLEKLTHFVRQFHHHQTAVPPKGGPPELQELSNAFEGMIAELDQSQAQLTRAAKLAVVGEMAAAMSHEVRTPLGIMRSSADILLREPQLSQDGREVLGFIISETERLNKLVTSLIDAARPRLPNFIALDLTQHTHHVMALLKNQAQAKQIEMVFAHNQPALVRADQDQMTQVLMNLLINAIQILPPHGKIVLHLDVHDDYAKLVVADNGPGIAPENQAQMFEPFFTQRAGGVGLGLAVVRQILQAHQGDIHYQASQWQGAQFTMTIPLYREEHDDIRA